MSTRLFTFNPAEYADAYAREGYVHIKSGVSKEFYERMSKQVNEYISTRVMKEFAIGDKQQAMYEFPSDGEYVEQLLQSVGAVCGLDPQTLVMSERHIKAYESGADPEPHAHKDRFASEVSVGISVHVREGSTLVLYPYDELDVNPFNASTLLRASLSTDRHPEPRLKHARRVEINDSPGDVIMFRGHKIWHLRSNPANTTMLYLKLNSMNCDPLGEDPRTAVIRQETQKIVGCPDDQLLQLIALIGRRVDYMHKFYDRLWQEVPGVVLWGEKHYTLDDDEFRSLKLMNGRRTVEEIITELGLNGNKAAIVSKIRKLALRGVVDLLPKRS